MSKFNVQMKLKIQIAKITFDIRSFVIDLTFEL
jgi:hypothetical protein